MEYIDPKELDLKRPAPFYFITTRDENELTYEKFYEDLSYMKKEGYGGIVLFNRPPEGFTRDLYFEEPWFKMVGNCLKAAKDLNFRVWLNDDYQAPPGDIGGKLKKIAPHLTPLHLKLIDGEVKILEANWGFPSFEEEESALLFQKYVYEEYKKRFGEYFGTTVVGIFSDADNRRVNSDIFNADSPQHNHFPWSRNFRDSFLKKYGYDIYPHLISVLNREKTQYSHDYWEHAGNLYMSWFESNYRWCRENGLLYTFHSGATTPFSPDMTEFNSVFSEGKAIDAGRLADFPGTDHEMLEINGGRLMLKERFNIGAAVWGGDDKHRRSEIFYDTYADLRAKQTQSGAYLYDAKGVMCEMFAGVNWNSSYKDLRNIASYQIMQGVNLVVYHAYHFKLHGETKFFAPHAFSRHSHTAFSIKDFNDMIARNTYICSQGKLKVDIALLDPTDYLWQYTADSRAELDVAKKLNNFTNGYIISDLKGLRKKHKELKAVVNPSLPLSKETRSEIESLGLKIYEADEIDNIETDFPTGIKWQGNNKLMFMRRLLPDGSEILAAANIESDETAKGTLTFDGKNYNISLTSGEIAFFGGGFDSFNEIKDETEKFYLSGEAEIKFEKKNIIPLMRWEDENRRGFSLVKPTERIFVILSAGWVKKPFEALNDPPINTPLFPFTVTEDIGNLELLFSHKFTKNLNKVYLDETELISNKAVNIFDDLYYSYEFEVKKGNHIIKLELGKEVDTPDNIYLRGDFDAEITTSGKPNYHYGVLSFQMYVPENAEVTLSNRSTKLKTNSSWTEQGQPLYSGYVDYDFNVEIPERFSKSTLIIPELQGAVKVYVDGEFKGSAIYPPYDIPLELSEGNHKITLRVANTLGNMFEGFKMPSGILETPYLIKR